MSQVNSMAISVSYSPVRFPAWPSHRYSGHRQGAYPGFHGGASNDLSVSPYEKYKRGSKGFQGVRL